MTETCYKIRRKSDGKYKTATGRWKRYGIHGNAYGTLGRATGALRVSVARHNKSRFNKPVSLLDYEVVEFELIQRKVHRVR